MIDGERERGDVCGGPWGGQSLLLFILFLRKD